jgi:hypothetical protein
MKELTDEQYEAIWLAGKEPPSCSEGERMRRIKIGRAAYAASFPYAVAEALGEFTDAEWSYISSVAKPLKPRDKDYPRNRADAALSRRVTALTAKPDAAVEAVTDLLVDACKSGREFSATELVAAVDAARAKEAK